MSKSSSIASGPLRFVRSLLAEPRMAGVDLDAAGRIEVHRRILNEKKMMKGVFTDIHHVCVDLDRRHLSPAGARVELGAGATALSDAFPQVLASDVALASHLDLALSATALPFGDASVGAYYGIDCFHHFNDPVAFFDELVRTLVPGGGCVLVEPYHGPVARQLFRRLFDSERFDTEQPSWSADVNGTGPMVGANQAMSYIVFERDRSRFAADWPQLAVVETFPLTNYLRYLASGGLNFRALVPAPLTPVLRGLEALLSPLRRILGLHHVIVLRKCP